MERPLAPADLRPAQDRRSSMKRFAATSALALALALALASPAHAAPDSVSTPPANPAAPPAAPSAADASRPQQSQQHAASPSIHVTSAGDIASRFAYDKNGRDAGWIEYVMIDARTGDIGYLVIGSDAGFDIGSKVIAAPWTAATKPELWGDRAIVLNTTVDKMQQAPRLDRSDLAKLVEPVAIRRVTDYYAQPSSGSGERSGSSSPQTNSSPAPGAGDHGTTRQPYLLVGRSVVETVIPEPTTA